MRATTSRTRRIAAAVCMAPILAVAAGAGAVSAAASPSSSHVASAPFHDSKARGDRCFFGDGWGWGWGDHCHSGWGWGFDHGFDHGFGGDHGFDHGFGGDHGDGGRVY
ncbi:hypothetical protein JL475_33725 [Streptomyces sp. M2CJ-2]|uniref:hypothetical protein n=1 Tax=Streptomyces sp. M2CJ-2 TaxID=2803948 RepID=UPI00192543D0|nr:hypothetical protein [Streptomyces sp. M2CJ-2]MBL3670831.1 hypothetical protein [Streptomyces sp. M2CJ-2]